MPNHDTAFSGAGVCSGAAAASILAESPLAAFAAARLIFLSGPAYFSAFFGSEAETVASLMRSFVRAGSVFSARNVALLLEEGSVVACAVALPGCELERAQKIDLASVLQRLGAAERIALLSRIRGKSGGAARAGEGDFYLRALAVDPHFRGRGFGRVLLQHVIGQARNHSSARCKLDVYSTNLPAVALYQHFGFVCVSRVLDPLTQDEVCTMELALDQSTGPV